LLAAADAVDSGEVLSRGFLPTDPNMRAKAGAAPMSATRPLPAEDDARGRAPALLTSDGQDRSAVAVMVPAAARGSRGVSVPEPPAPRPIDPRPFYPTGPLPAVRPDPSPSDPSPPRFSQEPWLLPQPSPAAPPAEQAPVAFGAQAPTPLGVPAPMPAHGLAGAPAHAPAGQAPRRGLRGIFETMRPRRMGAGAEVTLRVPLVLGLAAGALVLWLAAFFVGRATAPARSDMAEALRARASWAKAPQFSRVLAASATANVACLIQSAAARWAPAAARTVPSEILALADGKLAIGFARAPKLAGGIVVDPASGAVEVVSTPEGAVTPLARVVPLLMGDKLRFAETASDAEDLRQSLWVGASEPFVLAATDSAIVRLDRPGGARAVLWRLPTPTEPAEVLTTLVVPGRGVAAGYRHAGRIWVGWLSERGEVLVEAAAIGDVAVELGRPTLAFNGRELVAVYAERAREGDPPRLRWARGPAGKPLGGSVVLELPAGGPGGEAIAPAAASLSAGRTLLSWTEGSKGARALRLQTYDAELAPVGAALRVSPETGNFGQGNVGVAGEHAAVVFLLERERGAYELYGTVLSCGARQ
jgi:hypothetical protein